MRILRTSKRFRIYRTARRALGDAYPAAFPRRGRRPPLKVGILREILSGNDLGLSATQVRVFMQVWTSSTAYLTSVSKGGDRVDLTGLSAGTVDITNAGEAAKRIQSRRLKLDGGNSAA